MRVAGDEEGEYSKFVLRGRRKEDGAVGPGTYDLADFLVDNGIQVETLSPPPPSLHLHYFCVLSPLSFIAAPFLTVASPILLTCCPRALPLCLYLPRFLLYSSHPLDHRTLLPFSSPPDHLPLQGVSFPRQEPAHCTFFSDASPDLPGPASYDPSALDPVRSCSFPMAERWGGGGGGEEEGFPGPGTYDMPSTLECTRGTTFGREERGEEAAM
eukprot:751775-Hanusia_phi.AAC.1